MPLCGLKMPAVGTRASFEHNEVLCLVSYLITKEKNGLEKISIHNGSAEDDSCVQAACERRGSHALVQASRLSRTPARRSECVCSCEFGREREVGK